MIILQQNEKIYLVKRKHEIILKLLIFPFLLLFIVFLFLMLYFFFSEISWPKLFIEKFPEISKFKLNFIISFIFSLSLPVLWTLIFFIITKYYLTYWVVTNQRIIEVKLVGFFNVQYSSIELDKIQDITIRIKGLLPFLLRFGDLRIQTASEKGEFVFDQVGDPEIVKQVIYEAKIDYQKIKT